MGKMNLISAIVSAMLIFSSATAMAGSPYNLTLPAPGSRFTPHVVQPSLQPRPVINPSLGHAQRSTTPVHQYTAIMKNKSRRQGIVSAGNVRWNCKGNHCTTRATWVRPTVQMCKVLARSVGTIQSYGRRGAGLNTVDIRSCNTGIVIVKVNSQTQTAFNRGFAARRPISVPSAAGSPRTPPGIAPAVRGGFAPRVTGKANLRTLPTGNRNLAPKLKLSLATNNIHTLSKRPFKNRTGGGFAPRTGGGFVPGPGVPGGVRTVTSAQALEMTGKAGAAGGIRTVTSAQALEMTGKAGAAGGIRTATSAQALEMTGKAGATGGVRTVTSAQALEMTGKAGAAGGIRTVTSAQALEMTGK